MHILSTSFVTLHYRVSLLNCGNEVISTFQDRPSTLQMGAGQLALGLETCLLGLREGDHRIFELSPAQAYGERNLDLIQRVSVELLRREGAPGEQYNIGDIVEFPAPGHPHYAGVVKECSDESVVFDFNHPLAGHAVKFEVQIIGVL